MYNGDQARKKVLIEHGSACQCRATIGWEGAEFWEKARQTVFAPPPQDWEMEVSGAEVAEQGDPPDWGAGSGRGAAYNGPG